MTSLSIGLVTYHPHAAMLRTTLASLRCAVDLAREAGSLEEAKLLLVDNGNDPGLDHLAAQEGWPAASLLSGQGNVGFGRGHNLAISADMGELHLILNPDVKLQPDALVNALGFMADHPECGLLSPCILESASSEHFLCKRRPSLFNLFLRGFAPGLGQRFFSKRLAHYEMSDKNELQTLWDPPIASGCFMLFRSDILRKLGGFDPRYFLYFEDFDLSLRTGRISRLVAVKAVRIEHYGGGAGRKGWQHVKMFGASAWTFFNTHGWKFF